MPLIENRDYVISKKATVLLDGIVSCIVFGTKRHIFLLPTINRQGSGRSVKVKTTFIGDDSPITQILQKLTHPDAELEEITSWMRKIMLDDLKLSAQKYILKIDELEEFVIKDSLISKGIYYKNSTMKRRNGIGGIKKHEIQNFKNFYNK